MYVGVNFNEDIGDWGLGWGLGIGPNPQSPIPNPHYIYIKHENSLLNVII